MRQVSEVKGTLVSLVPPGSGYVSCYLYVDGVRVDGFASADAALDHVPSAAVSWAIREAFCGDVLYHGEGQTVLGGLAVDPSPGLW